MGAPFPGSPPGAGCDFDDDEEVDAVEAEDAEAVGSVVAAAALPAACCPAAGGCCC